MATKKITTLFTDLGGVLLTNGWDRSSRNAATKHFELDVEEVQERHHLTFDTYEVGKISLDIYLDRVIFYEPREFSRQEFKTFMYNCSRPHEDMLAMMRELKAKNNIRIAAVSNEGRELTTHRIKSFNLSSFIDFYIVSSFVHFRKPDTDIFKIALDTAQALPQEVLYIDDRAMFVEVANQLGIHGIVHS
ncbi:MAG: HAD-IA family hydrolase, partial [Ferruginibacter sp.]